MHQDQGNQDQPDCNQAENDDQQAQDNRGTGKGKKNKKKPSQDGTPHPGTSHGANVIPRMDFQSRNLGTGRPTIQCTSCEEYTNWSRSWPL